MRRSRTGSSKALHQLRYVEDLVLTRGSPVSSHVGETAVFGRLKFGPTMHPAEARAKAASRTTARPRRLQRWAGFMSIPVALASGVAQSWRPSAGSGDSIGRRSTPSFARGVIAVICPGVSDQRRRPSSVNAKAAEKPQL